MADLLCPRCEKSVESHVDGECPGKKLSRRFFLGTLGSTFAAAALAKVLPNVQPVDMATGPDHTALIEVVAPKVHEGGYIILDHNFEPATLAHDIYALCKQTGRPVLGKVQGEVRWAAYPDPNDKRNQEWRSILR